MLRTRAEHLQFCKQRALEYLDRGDLRNAVTSMMSDLNKHPETKGQYTGLGMIGIMCAINHDHDGMRRFIEGFR